MSKGLSLEAFNTIANGKFNVGEISLNSKGNGLAKVNNHVYRTSQNNVRLTADQNRSVRTALMNAFTAHFKNDTDMLGAIREQLLGGGRDACSLNREYVRHLIAAATDTSGRDRMKLVADAGSMRLLDRRIKTVDAKCGKTILQSSKAETLEMVTREKSSLLTLQAQDELSKFLKADNSPKHISKNPLDAIGVIQDRIENVSRAVKRALVNQIQTTSGWDESRVAAFGARLSRRIMSSGFCNNNARLFSMKSEAEAKAEYLQDFQSRIREIYKEFDIDDKMADRHLERIFPENA